jgi:YD repeat-containing protein
MERLAADGLIAPPTGTTWALERLELATAALPLQVARPAWEYRDRESYSRAVYTKAALVMKTLGGLLGEERMARALLRAYATSFARRHPRGEDLQQVLEESSGEDLGWFFDQAVRTDATVDWAVGRVRSRADRPPSGLTWDGADWVERDHGGRAADSWTTEVQVLRRGTLSGPVEVLVTLADGTVERRTWDGRGRWVGWRFAARVVSVVVDPDGVWAMETRRRDNYWRSPEDASGTRPVLWWLGGAARLLVELAVAPWS